ncbi:MAG: hypothetical protein WD960_04165 [Gemmatimonadota bacterium]
MARPKPNQTRWRIARESRFTRPSTALPAAARLPRLVQAGALALALLFAAIPAPGDAQETQWIHIRVEEPDATRVNLNLPISLVDVGLQIAEGHMTEDQLRWGAGEGVEAAELRQLWAALRDAGDTELMEIEDGDTHVRVSRLNDRVLVRVEEGGETTVRFETPSSVIDALLGTEGDRLDIRAAIRELARTGEQDVLDIRDGDTRVRIWVADRQDVAGVR